MRAAAFLVLPLPSALTRRRLDSFQQFSTTATTTTTTTTSTRYAQTAPAWPPKLTADNF